MNTPKIENDIWTKMHSFENGYGWHRTSDNFTIYNYDLHDYDIVYRFFPSIEIDIQNKIISEIKAKRKQHLEAVRKNPIKIEFNQFIMPVIHKFPNTNEIMNELVSVQPMPKNTLKPFYEFFEKFGNPNITKLYKKSKGKNDKRV